jgi:hypothetical protein
MEPPEYFKDIRMGNIYHIRNLTVKEKCSSCSATVTRRTVTPVVNHEPRVAKGESRTGDPLFFLMYSPVCPPGCNGTKL